MIAEIYFDRKAGKLITPRRAYAASNDVRTLRDKTRGLAEVVRTIPDGHPYDPDIFPAGRWLIGKPQHRETGHTVPYFIPTAATRRVKIWTLKNGRYYQESNKEAIDAGYGLHYSRFATTLGCIRLYTVDALLSLVNELALYDEAWLTVEAI